MHGYTSLYTNSQLRILVFSLDGAQRLPTHFYYALVRVSFTFRVAVLQYPLIKSVGLETTKTLTFNI